MLGEAYRPKITAQVLSDLADIAIGGTMSEAIPMNTGTRATTAPTSRARVVAQQQAQPKELVRTRVGLVAGLVMCAVSVWVVVITWNARTATGNVSQGMIRAATVSMAAGIFGYTFCKEMRLCQLASKVRAHAATSITLESRIDELTALSAAAQAANAVLEPRQVLDVILNGALGVLRGTTGSIMLLEGEFLHTAAQAGNPGAEGAIVRIGDSIAGRVAKTRRPLIIEGAVSERQFHGHTRRSTSIPCAMSVPLVHRGEMLGVLNVNASGDQTFGEYDLAVAQLFSDAAAVAIANAKLFDAERSHVADLLDRDRRRQAFVASVSHEFNNPLTSLRGVSSLLQRLDLPQEDAEVVQVLDRQVQRLAGLVEDLKSGSSADHVNSQSLRRIDLAALVRVVATDSEVAGRPVRVSGVRTAVVLGDQDALRRVIDNLIDNAFKYGVPPVDVSVKDNGHTITLRVADRGQGVPPREQAKVFERHYRRAVDHDRPGQGIGLSIVRGIVDSLRGQVWIDAPGGEQGMAVVVALPCAERNKV